MSAATALLLAVATWQSPSADTLRSLALRISESAVAAEVRARPLAVRDAVAEALRLSVQGPSGSREEAMATARALAGGYAAAWRDSFLLREVARFAAWPPQRKAARLWADSVRRAGNATYGTDGPAAAIAVWRRALARASHGADTTTIAAALGNIGAAWLALGQLDSAGAALGRAERLAAAMGDFRVQANTVGALAALSQDRSDPSGAHRGYTRALSLRGRIGDTRGIASDHNNLGVLSRDEGDLAVARRHFEQALALNRADDRDEVAATNLLNLAGIAALAGDFADAEARYWEALATWEKRRLPVQAAGALHGLGQLEMRRGDYPAAETALREALALYDRSGQVAERLGVQHALAAALAAAGDLQGALEQLRAAERVADSAPATPHARAGVVLARADLEVQLNHPAAAERLYRRAIDLYREAKSPGGEAEARQGVASLLRGRQDLTGAEAMLQVALRTQRMAGYQRSAALTRAELGKLHAQRGDTVRARDLLLRAEAELQRLGDPVAVSAVVGDRAGLEAAGGRPAAAAALYREALERLGDRVAPDVAWRLHAGLGRAWSAQGSPERAARELRAALVDLERPTTSLGSAERRSAFLADKWAVYADLARIEQARRLPGAAFALSESLRAREMLELLGRGRIGSPPLPAGLARREQDLRRRIAELTAPPSDPALVSLRGPDVALPPSTREALLAAQEEYGELLSEMRERAPRHAALVAGEVSTWRQVAHHLRADQAVIEYLVSDSGSLAFVLTADTLLVVDLSVGRRELARLVEFARGVLEARAPAQDSLWRAPLRRLHGHLIAPVEATGVLAGKVRLILIPHAELHYLPFPALLEDAPRGRFLIQRYQVAQAPSAAVLVALEERPDRRGRSGLLALAPRAEALPGSRREVEAFARMSDPPGRALIGAAATEEAFRREAPARRDLHLATFGILNKANPLFSYVELASGGGQDGRLEVHEIFGLTLAADLVVLSACRTGLGSGALADVPAGDDWVGLTRAFLHAGASRVVATLWPVEDWPTAALMERFYREYTGHRDAVRALAEAQRAALALPTTSHPFTWAGFLITGGVAGRGKPPQ